MCSRKAVIREVVMLPADCSRRVGMSKIEACLRVLPRQQALSTRTGKLEE